MDIQNIKETNTRKLSEILRELKTATKPELAKKAGISVVTVGTLINDLLQSGEALEAEILPSTGGRPAMAYRYNPDYKLALTIHTLEQYKEDIILYSVVNLFGEVLETVEQKETDIDIHSFDEKLAYLIMKYPKISYIGFAMPVVESERKLFISDYQGLRNQYFRNYMEEKYHLPICIENDINAAVLGHYSRNTEDEYVVGIYFPSKYPPGAGICLNGKIYRGKSGMAGEISRLPIGIDWASFPYDNVQIRIEMEIKMIEAVQCMYNPDKVVLYGVGKEDNIISLYHNDCMKKNEKLYSKFEYAKDMAEDQFYGIRQLCLELLNNKINNDRILETKL